MRMSAGGCDREAGEPTVQHRERAHPLRLHRDVRIAGAGVWTAGRKRPRAIRDPGDAGRPTAGCGAGGSCTAKHSQEAHFHMNLIALRQKTGRLALVTSSTAFVVGLAFLNGGQAHSIGGLCNGEPASHTWLDASGQYGPALLDGTDHDDTIVGSDGDDTIDAGDGNDFVCGAAGDDSIAGSDGDDAIRADTGDDDLDGGAGR